MTDRVAPDTLPLTPQNEQGGRWRRWHLTSRDAVVALIVAALTVTAQTVIDDRREDKADRRENLRFLREQAASDNIKQVQMINIDLSGQNLAGLRVSGAVMPGANLKKSDLSFSMISNSDLSKADMEGADLSRTALVDSTLEDSNLRRANLSNAQLMNVAVSGVDFTGASLESALIHEPQHRTRDLYFTNFTAADMRFADLSEVEFHGVSFYGADLRGAKLSIQPDDVICYGPTTRWSEGFQPPPSAAPDDCRPE